MLILYTLPIFIYLLVC